jgi:hypothetical protein
MSESRADGATRAPKVEVVRSQNLRRAGEQGLLLRKALQPCEQAALFRLRPRTRVIRHETCETLAPHLSQEAGPVERMEAVAGELGRVADVVQIRGGDENVELALR